MAPQLLPPGGRPGEPKPAAVPTRSLASAVLRLRCPRCREGRMFKGVFAMNDPCPVCGLVFEREPGYFLGAMFFSYALGAAVLIPLYFLLQWFFPGWPGWLVALVAWLPYLPLVPLIVRYARVLWIYFDRFGAPTDLSTPEGWLRRRKGTPP